MQIHPVFHNSLLKPYKETTTHGPNFTHPPPEIVGGEEGHYEIKQILTSRPTRNRKSTQYLIKWKGYPDSKNSWLPAKELQSAQELLEQFHNRQVRIITTNQALQAQWKPKEGILSWASPTPPYLKRGSHTKAPSPPNPTLRPLPATLQIFLPRFISQEQIFRGFPCQLKLRGVTGRVSCYINISAMLGFRVDTKIDKSIFH